MDDSRPARGRDVPGTRFQADRDDLVTAALRPLVDQPAVEPRPVADVAADARRRTVRRRSLATVAGAILLVAVAGLASAFDSPPAVTTADQPSRPSVPGPASTDPATAPSVDGSSTTAEPDADTSATTAPSTSSSDGSATTDASPAPAGTPPAGARPHEPFAGIEAEAADDTSGATAANGGTTLRLGDGGGLLFRDVDFSAGPATRFEVVVACADVPTSLHVRLDDPTSAPVATVHLTSTGGWTRFVTAAADTTSTLSGRHDVYLTVDAGAPGPAVAVDRLRFA